MRYLILALMLLLPLAAEAATAIPLKKTTRSPADLHLASISALVVDVESGETLYRKNDALALPIASVTKLMTAMVTLDAEQPLDEWLKIAAWDDKFGKNAYSRLRLGSEGKRGDLIRIALMSSENLATHVLAQNYPGGRLAFVAAMNAKAKAVGMTDSVFMDPAGLSPKNQSTARDLSRMAAAAYRYPKIREFSTGHQYVPEFRNPTYTLPYGNTNPLVASERWSLQLTKTGYLTEAGRCLLMIAQIDAKPVIMVLLNSLGTRTPIGDAARVRRWLTTGEGSTIDAAAREYEKRMITSLRIGATAVGGI